MGMCRAWSLALLILVFSATGLFAQLQYTLNRAWEVKPDPKQGGVLAFIVKRDSIARDDARRGVSAARFDGADDGYRRDRSLTCRAARRTDWRLVSG